VAQRYYATALSLHMVCTPLQLLFAKAWFSWLIPSATVAVCGHGHLHGTVVNVKSHYKFVTSQHLINGTTTRRDALGNIKHKMVSRKDMGHHHHHHQVTQSSHSINMG
jgi:hypothetical protein